MLRYPPPPPPVEKDESRWHLLAGGLVLMVLSLGAFVLFLLAE
jgi:hypothetical protein